MNYNIYRKNDIYILDESKLYGVFSGNKYRKLDYILEGFNNDGIITYGSVYSNHCLASTYYAKSLNVPIVIIVIIEDEEEKYEKYPNIKLIKNLGANIVYIKRKKAHERIKEIKKKYSDYFWIPGGGHTEEGMLAYYNLFNRIFKEKKEMIRKINYIVLPFGTGTTSLGILKAINEKKEDIKIIGLSVARDKVKCLDSCLEFFNKDELDKLEIVTDYYNRYGDINKKDIKYRDLFFKKYNIILDPIYNIRSGRYIIENNLNNLLFINTGGIGNLFL